MVALMALIKAHPWASLFVSVLVVFLALKLVG